MEAVLVAAVPLSKIPNPHTGPCDELETHPGVELPLPICSWDRLQHPPCDSERDNVLNMVLQSQ